MLQRPDDWVYLRGFLSVPPSTKSESSLPPFSEFLLVVPFLQHLLNSKEQSETKAALEKSQIHTVRPCQA
ncbi:hypothetical protein DTO021D3_5510 [Paecilomyces variotii]|nr:hypothetical protein DTO032I3_8441 [Paecilomyces variotii]KAJ9277676.1 hypothetical protein DTO021D3_5510 [Paecilomyces variotii]KAJ9341936.1 hypothetical protein DTO027B6_5586 [Paecilomyces variotii]KAJ9389322.1 hypothetical protein DTO032I4_2347 [Paecilomyces variotii]